MNMLKQVPGLGADTRLGMINQYSTAPDKFTKSAVLKSITSQVVDHMAQNLHNLDPATAKVIDQMIAAGTTDAMSQLSGKGIPNTQMFSAAKSSQTGSRVDKFEDNEGIIVAPQAKTQLSYSEPLLDVHELHRALYRTSGYLQSLKLRGGAVRDNVMSVADTIGNVWKATTLLRPGYILRAPSEEMAASAVKFGLMSSIMSTIHGGANWALNRDHYVKALVGKGSYTSTTGGASRVVILDPGVAQKALARGDKVTRINVGKAWPVVMDRIDNERAGLKDTQASIEKMKADPTHDPADLNDLYNLAASHTNAIEEHRDYADAILQEAHDATGRRLGEGTIIHNGREVPQAFNKEWPHPIPRDQITSEHNMEVAFARGEGIDTSRMIKTGSWAAITPDQPNHMESWLNAVNKQFGQDDLFRKVAEDPTLKTASNWLKTPAGRYHVSQLGPMARDQQRLLLGIRDTLDHYLPPPSLQGKLSRGEQITESDLRSSISKEDFTPVHGEEVKGLTAKGSAATAAGVVDRIIEKGFHRLSTIPTDILSRQPTYLRAQEARMRQLMDQEVGFMKAAGHGDAPFTDDQINDMLQKSDGMARKDISQIVYDPTRTTATQALRFIAPFLSAQIDGLERWGGLVAEKPAFVGTAAKIYNAPVAAHLVTDNQGNYVDENGYAVTRDENGKIIGKHFVPMQGRTIHMKVPPGTRGLAAALTGTGGKEIPVKISALNTILPGDPWWNPGTGPVVQVAASQLAKKQPALGDFLQWSKVMPYGATPGGIVSDLQSAFTPKYVSEMWDATHPNDAKFQQTMLQEYQRQVADYHNGGPAPDIRKAEANAKSFSFLKAFTSWISPAQVQETPLTGTPYQFYIDQYKKMQQADPKNADASFLQKYGEDYFVFTTSLSKSMGIAPTVSALATAKKYKDLIAGDSTLASFIVGDTYNQGKFSSSAFAAEQGMTIGGQAVRGRQSVQDALQQNQANLGWAEYKQYMNGMDSSLIRAGFHSYTQSGAEQFLQGKQNIIGMLKQRFPAWEQAFDTTDKGLVPRRIQSFEILVQDPKLANDPMRQDIPALYADAILQEAHDATGRRLGEGTIIHNGREVPQAFNKEWPHPIPRDQITSEHNMEVAFARGEGIDTSRMIKTGSWAAITPDQPNHMESWLNAVNKQFGQDDLFRKVAEDPTLKTASNWLKTPAGRYHVSQLGPMARDQQRLLLGIRDTLDHYLPPPSLQGKLSRGEQITESDLRSSISKEDFAPVHGEEVKGLTAKGSAATAAGVVDRIIEKSFHRLATIPTDILSRQPTYLRAQEARMRQLMDQEVGFMKAAGHGDAPFTDDQINDMLQKSDGMARKDISQIVYDPTRTTATQALRFIAPFLAAHIDGLERWGGLVAEKPAFVGTAAKIYNAPVAAHLVTDNQGNYVDENGYAVTRDENGKIVGKHFVPMQGRTIHMKVPPGTRGLAAALTGTGGKEIPVKISALNTILPGDPWWNPGTGPVVQVAASQLAKKQPALGDFLQWSKVMPYGATSGGIVSDLQSAFTPKYVSEMWDATHPNDAKFQQTMLQEYQRQVADYHNGGPAPDIRKAEANAKSFSFLKAFTSWISPAQVQETPLTGTPYQFYIDQYKKMQQADPKNADASFLQKYGEDYFVFTTSLSKSMGIAPTVSALATAKKYKDLIAGDSTLAPFIVGDTYNQGKFSSSAFAAEQGMTIGGQAVRGRQSVQDALQQNQANLGWAEYKQYMNGMDSSLIRAGFHSYTQSGAEQFLQGKQNIIGMLKQRFPAWEQAFDTTDKGLVPRRIQSFEILVQDPKLANDPMRQDIPALRAYLEGRQAFKAALNQRGASELSAGDDGVPTGPNADLGQQWRAFQTQMVASNTKFGDVFNTYLSHDNLQ